MTRPWLVLSLVILVGCASGPASGPVRTVSQTLAVTGTNDRLTVSAGDGPHTSTLAFTPEQVWRALPAALDSLGVPVTRIDPATRTIGNDGFKIRQRMGKTPLSRFIDCGQTQIGPNADSYEVYITVVVQVTSVTGGTASIATTFDASARPLAFSQAYSRCTTRGLFETRLLDAIRAQLPK